MVKRTIYIFVNGINTFPGNSKNWTGKATTFIQSQTPHKAEKVEYFCSVFTRALHNKDRAHKLYRTLSYYRNWNIILVAHSNGCDVVLDCLNYYSDWPNIKHIHLISGACEADFVKNNLNKYLLEHRIDKCSVYVSGHDIPIRLAHTLLGKILGYGYLGRFGPINVHENLKNRVKTFWNSPWNKYGHSDCFKDKNFAKTMKLIV